MLAQRPPLGWNSWNTFGYDINEQIIKETANAFIESGLKDAGYEYIVLDDVWQNEKRVNGRLTWNKKKFPNGIPALAEYIHSLGLKFGIYSCAGTHTCTGMPASYGYEEEDAQTFAEWGADFVKYDGCFVPPGVDYSMLYRRMGQALRATDRQMIYSICEGGLYKPWEWGAISGGHMWRTTTDIIDSWDSILEIGFRKQKNFEKYAGPGHWNDPDMLVVGMRGQGNVGSETGCTDAEYKSHFALWCLLAAPLMIGCDVRNMDKATKTILMNKNLIEVNQDILGQQGYCVGKTLHCDQPAAIYAKSLNDGSIAVGLFNLGETDQRIISVAWESIGLHDRRKCKVIDLISGDVIGVYEREFSAKVKKHDVSAIKLIPILSCRPCVVDIPTLH